MQVTDRSFPSYLHRKFPYFDVCLPGSDILWWRFSKNSCLHLLDAFFEVFWSLSFDESSDFVTSTTSFSEYNFFPPNTIRSGGSFSRFSSFFALRFLASVTKAKRVFNLRISASTLRSWVIKGKCLRGLRPRSTTYTLYSLICQYRLCSLLVFPLGVLFAILRQSSPCLVCHHQQHFLPFALLML